MRHVTEPLLASLIDASKARSLFRWLAKLSFMEMGLVASTPHDLARDVLFGDLKWRNSARLAELIEGASAYFAAGFRETGRGTDLALADDLLFLHSHHPVIGAFAR